MKKIMIIGHFGGGKIFLDGQTVKTKIIAEELESILGSDEVFKIDTYGGKKNLLKAPFQVSKALRKAENVIILPANNGLRVYVPLLSFFRKFFKKRKLHYIVIGGWLASYIEKKKGLKKKLKKFNGIYVETNTMKDALEKQGFSNVTVMPNCKKLSVLKKEELIKTTEEPLKLCTFSRVCEQKGIGDAVKAVKEINEKLGRTVYSLDIYGLIDKGQEEWFKALEESFPEYVCYRGGVPFDESVETLKNYFALLFPTKFYTEGIPGTIIDAYAAGIPVISSKWESFSDIIDDGTTGIGYEFGNEEGLYAVLEEIAKNPDKLNELKEKSLEKAQEFIPETVVKEFLTKAEIKN